MQSVIAACINRFADLAEYSPSGTPRSKPCRFYPPSTQQPAIVAGNGQTSGPCRALATQSADLQLQRSRLLPLAPTAFAAYVYPISILRCLC